MLLSLMTGCSNNIAGSYDPIIPQTGGAHHAPSRAVYLLPKTARPVRAYHSHKLVADAVRYDRYAILLANRGPESRLRRPSGDGCIYTYLNTSGEYDPNLDLLIDVQCAGGGGGGSGSGSSNCSRVDTALNQQDVNNFLTWLATALNFAWSTDLGPKVNAFGNTIKDNTNKFGKGNDVNGRVYDHATDLFGKSAGQLSANERQLYDWMKYSGPALRDTNRGFVGTQIGNPNFELYAFKSDKWIDIARYDGLQTTLTPGNFVITFFDRAKGQWISTYEVTQAELQQKAMSFLRATQQSYEPGFDPAMEDSADSFDWDAYDAALQAADDSAYGC
jgi:hypothetical protein